MQCGGLWEAARLGEGGQRAGTGAQGLHTCTNGHKHTV